MGEDRPKVIAIVGPTAVGKTVLALEVAKLIDAEIVNADSMQVYRFMEIGTAKPTAMERAEGPHHLLDMVEPDDDFKAMHYSQLARTVIEDLARKGKPALVVGGTGLYLKALFHGLFPGAYCDQKVRERLRRERCCCR